MCLSLRRKVAFDQFSSISIISINKSINDDSFDDFFNVFQFFSIQFEQIANTQFINSSQYIIQIINFTQFITQIINFIQLITQINVFSQDLSHFLFLIFSTRRTLNCLDCHKLDTKYITKIDNKNNNAHRLYYICRLCKYNIDISNNFFEKDWINWDDNVDIVVINKACFCDSTCKQDRASKISNISRFWTCASERCKYLSYKRDEKTNRKIKKMKIWFDDKFESWLL